MRKKIYNTLSDHYDILNTRVSDLLLETDDIIDRINNPADGVFRKIEDAKNDVNTKIDYMTYDVLDQIQRVDTIVYDIYNKIINVNDGVFYRLNKLENNLMNDIDSSKQSLNYKINNTGNSIEQ